MSSRTNSENLVSIRQVVAEKNTEVLFGQTDKQTDRNAIPSPLARLTSVSRLSITIVYVSTNKKLQQTTQPEVHMAKRNK